MTTIPTTYTSMDGYTFHRVLIVTKSRGHQYVWVATPTPEDPDTWDLIHDDKSFREVFIPEDQEALADLERMNDATDALTARLQGDDNA